MLAVFWLYERASLEERIDASFTRWATDIATDVSPLLPNITSEELARVGQRRMGASPFQPLMIKIYDQQGRHVASNTGAPVAWQSLGLPHPERLRMPDLHTLPIDRLEDRIPEYASSTKAAVVSVQADGGQRYSVVVMTADSLLRRRVRELTQVALSSAVIGVLAATASSWFIAGIAVAPFDRLRALAQRLDPASAKLVPTEASKRADLVGLVEELESARRRIRERYAAQERFLSNVSHEIKTPIAIMLVEAQTLDAREASADVRRFVTSVQDELHRLGHLLESLLTLTRIQGGKGLPRALACGVNDVVMDSIGNCARMAAQYRVQLVPYLLGEEDSVDATVSGDPDLLRTMIENLLRSAIRFSPEQSTVEVRLACQPDSIVIKALDRGPNVPPESLSTIFDRFAQASGGSRQGRGQGLGLSIAQGIAELHRGHIVATNREAGGCSFAITLPRLIPTESPEAVAQPGPGYRNGASH